MRKKLSLNQWMVVAWVSLSFLIALFLLTTYCPKEQIEVFQIPQDKTGSQAVDMRLLFPNGSIDPNTASAEAFWVIPGIGEKTAAAILAERELNGPFYFPEDLLAVKGIGKKKLESVRPYLCFPSLNGVYHGGR